MEFNNPNDRYRRMESAHEFGQERSLIQLRHEVQALRAAVLTLIASAVHGTAPDLQAEPLRSFLGTTATEDPAQTINRLMAQAGVVLGKVNCPTCGAVVEDKLGITDERCIFCGTQLTTER
jgi:hypothetical protein